MRCRYRNCTKIFKPHSPGQLYCSVAHGRKEALRRRKKRDGSKTNRKSSLGCKNRINHHKGVRQRLGPIPTGMTVSRTCEDNCPSIFVGYNLTGNEHRPYFLCRDINHYAYEPYEDNQKRSVTHGIL